MKIKKIVLYIFALTLFYSCNDFLNVKDESAINPAIWNNESSAELYINNIYDLCLPGFGGDKIVPDGSLNAISDETASMDSKLLLGTLEMGKVGTISALTYQSVRYINIAFDEMKTSKLTGDARKNILGQLFFFRAFQHWKMVELYGGVPYMKDVVDYTSSDAITNAPRNTTSECIALLKEDLDSAINNLPAVWTSDQYARVTRGAAAAFLGRILLFYASPEFNPSNDINRWKNAYEANLYARDLCTQDGYALMDISTPITDQWPVEKDFNKIFITKKSDGNPEVILVKPYLKALKYHGYENSVRPVEITNSKDRPSNCPSWDLVISFPMKDGTLPFNSSRKFIGNSDINKYYLDRDPRFYATVAYNGCYYPLEGNSSRRQWTYTGGEGTTSDLISLTGFYCRKYVNPDISGDERDKTYTDWIEIRYAEVLLNLAESAFEYQGDNSQVGYDCLIDIRKRAGIEPGIDGYYGLKSNPAFTPIEIVMNERRVELAFEGKRFFDLRRRNMFTNDLGTNIIKLNDWKKSGSGYTFTLTGITASNFDLIKNTLPLNTIYSYFKMNAKSTGPLVKAIAYRAVTTQADLQTTTTGNYNFFDIPEGIMTRSPAVKQTLGWPAGEFDPFK
ncbi:MAG: RagB/SusD family nutrient uptake outer membrane protein [Paludibacter sp.]|nr:RagB/SusD family nutrient uptake outer membrane protein [Paludibacter sp.]